MKLTENFNSNEFNCKDGTPVPAEFMENCKAVARNLQVLRNHVGRPVRITGSGYRTPSHNTKVGGAKHSQHLTCSAADINIDGFTPVQTAAHIEALIKSGLMKQGGIGIYKGFVHYDIRGTKARW